MADDTQQRAKEQRRRRREWIIIAVTLVAVAAITYLETQVVDLGADLPLGSSILVFALININTLLLLLLIFLVFRNLVKLIMERRRGVMGSRLRTSMVLAFVTLSLVPTILMFFAAFQFVGTSIEFWFSAQVERSLFDALEVAEAYNKQVADSAGHHAHQISEAIEKRRTILFKRGKALTTYLERNRSRYELAAVRVYSADLVDLGYATQSGTHISHLEWLPLELVSQVISSGQPLHQPQAAPTGDYTAAIHPITRTMAGKPKVIGAAVVFRLLPPGSLARIEGIKAGLESYRQLLVVKNPIKTNQYITLSLVALLIVFAATWFGFHLAKTITVPLIELAEGTSRIAQGDYDFFIDLEGHDEIGTLVNAFNRMTADLKTSRARLEEAHTEMRRTNLELEQRRRYMEIVLNNVAAGVIAADAKGVITTLNPSAERMLRAQAGSVLGRHWHELLAGEERELVDSLLSGLIPGGRSTVDRQVRLNMGGETLSLMVHLGFLRDERSRDLGIVVVFEDLTELEKAQRMAAWREVARRIAHEVKNPLTPIKLSAQRLIRRYGSKLPDDGAVFDECTHTIIDQVEQLRELVSEFSNFARLPMAKLAPADLVKITGEALGLYRGGHPDISFELEVEGEIPVFDFDAEQMNRVLINLLDNAVTAVDGVDQPGQVVLRLYYDDIVNILRMELEDNGPGVSPGDKLHLFEPYFSTKKTGTGLGLAIVSTIISDHNGYIRVQDNEMGGTRIVVELPVRNPQPLLGDKA